MDALDRITPAVRLGDRLVLRYRLPDSSATDVIGWVDALDVHRVSVADHQGRQTSVGRELVVAARRAPAARGGPDPMRLDAEDLEQLTMPAWVAEHEPLGQWTLRAGGGFTGRANSCLAVGDPGTSFAAAADRIVAYASGHAIEPRAQVVVGSGPERALRSLGWTETSVRTDVLVTRLGTLLGDSVPDPRVVVDEHLTPDWEAAYRRSRPNDAEPGLLRQILQADPPCGFASEVVAREVTAIGRGHVSGDWLGLASVWTAPGHRRHGLATAVMIALGHWAARLGARYVYLQVASENEPARLAYRRSGFVHHHSYLYLTAPS